MPEEKHHLCSECFEFYKENKFAVNPDLWCMHEWKKAKEQNETKKAKNIKKK